MSMCAAPFNQLYLHSSGKVYPCSFLQNDPKYIMGDLTNQTITEIWNSIELKKFRDNHVNEDQSLRCFHNQKKYLCDKLNNRSFYNNFDKSLKRIDIMLDSFCNLVCVMCTNIYDETGGFKKQFFWDNNDVEISKLTEIELVGGEPLISPYFYKLVDKTIAQNQKCQWKITTNANYPITTKLKKALEKLNFTTFAISLDSLKKDVFEQIRQKSSHELVMSNITTYQSFIKSIHINMVVQTLNHDEVFEMYHWAQERGFKFYPILLTYPELHSLLTLPLEQLKDIVLRYIQDNQKVRSIEIFFLIKKIIYNSFLQKDLDILSSYQVHLEQIGNAHE